MLNLKKKKLSFWINTCFIAYLLINAIIFLVKGLQSDEYKIILEELQFTSRSQIMITYSLFILTGLLSAVFNNLLPILIIIAINIGFKKAKKEKLSDMDFKEYKGYYKDIIDQHPAAVLSYIDNFELDNKDIAATLLELKMKGYINIEGDEIKILNSDYTNLNPIERYLINNLSNHNMSSFSQIVIEEARKQGLVQTQHDLKNKIIGKVVVLISTIIAITLLLNLIPSGSIDLNEASLLMICGIIAIVLFSFLGILYPFFSSISLVSYIIANATKPYVRSKKGEEINEMLEGLKNYLKDFSMLDQRNIEALTLWDEYLIYSVLFGQNKNILNEFSSLKYNKDGNKTE